MSSIDHRYYFGPTKFVKKRILLRKTNVNDRWDFTLREEFDPHRLFISTVRWNSDSYLKGLRPNDQILSINRMEINSQFSLKTIEEILFENENLDLIVLTLRIDQFDSLVYHWYNPIEERSTSPPPSNYLSRNAILNYPERTVKMNVDKGRKLGLVIRGGCEYGLGIFISGVDRGSLSEQKGLSIGDQILSVNGNDFRHISHENAVEILRRSSFLTLHLRQMNKLPQPKSSTEELNQWKERRFSSSSSSNIKNQFEEKLCSFVENSSEKSFFRNSLNKYLKKKISIDQLLKEIHPLIEQFSTSNKKFFLENLREFLFAEDRDHFDIYLLKEDFHRLKKCHDEFVYQYEMSTNTKWKSRSLGNLNSNEENRIRRPSSLEFNSNSNLFQTNFNDEENHFIEEFLQDYSSPYRLTIHKVRPTLGIAIEGGKSDRIPLPRIVYIQPDGSAYLSSGLRVGDVLLTLNGSSFRGLTHRQCALMIASAFKDSQRSTMDFLVVQPKSD